MPDGKTIVSSDGKIATITTEGTKERLDVNSNLKGSTVSEGKISVTNASTVIKSANSNRISLIIVNDSTREIYISKSGTATLNEGIRLNRSGGNITITDYAGAVSGITAAGTKDVTFSEVSI